MLVAAVFWRADGPAGTVPEVMGQPDLAHYVEGWPRAGDHGVVAEEVRPIGAAWMRRFTMEDPGFGFVDAAVPEVAMGVVKEWRGRGVGGRLLVALLDVARQQRVDAVSLSVEADNYAMRLYERVGFRTVDTVEGSCTMLLRL
jgi:ribosomal protein S18 acetylase RimI-like enzyme